MNGRITNISPILFIKLPIPLIQRCKGSSRWGIPFKFINTHFFLHTERTMNCNNFIEFIQQGIDLITCTYIGGTKHQKGKKEPCFHFKHLCFHTIQDRYRANIVTFVCSETKFSDFIWGTYSTKRFFNLFMY